MIELILFLVALALRMLARIGVPQDFDSLGHLYFAKQLKAEKGGPFDSINIQVCHPAPYFHPFLWHWLVGFFSLDFVSKHQKYWNPLLDAMFTAAVYLLALKLGFSQYESLVASCLYILTPMWFTRLSMGPRIQSFSPRLSGELATNLFFVVVCLPLNIPIWSILLLGTWSSGYVLSSSKFGVQALLFLTPLVSIFLQSWVPLGALGLGIVLLAVASKGLFLNSLKQQLSHLRWYFLKNLKGGMAVSNRNRFDDLYRRRKEESGTHYLARFLIMLIGRNSFTGLLFKLPVLWVSLVLLAFSPDISVAIYLWAAVVAACIVFLAINFPALLFLGEAERYLNHVAIFIILFAVEVAVKASLEWVLWLIAAYGLIFLFCEALLLPKLNVKARAMNVDDDKVIAFLKTIEASTVLAYPYHAGGGVYRIMSLTPHRTIFPFATTAEFVQKLERDYASQYPYVDLQKLDQMQEEFGVSILVVRKEALNERMGEHWRPSSKWKEIDLSLSLQRVFLYSCG